MRWRYWYSAGAVVRWVDIKKALPDEEEELSQCAPGGIRTPNLLIRSQMLYPIELEVQIKMADKVGFEPTTQVYARVLP